MDIKISNGDYVLAPNGRPKSIFGRDELIQRITNCLKIRKGSFAPAPEIGSRLYLLKEGSGASVKQLCEAALSSIPEVSVENAAVSFDNGRALINLKLTLCGKESYEVTL